MDRKAPDKLVLEWLGEIPLWQRDALVTHYVFMTSPDSGHFALSGVEAWHHFKTLMTQPEFPLRRVALILSVRALFTFLLEFSEPGTFPVASQNNNVDEIYPFDSIQFLRSCKHWRQLCQEGLSDGAIQEWLLSLQG